MRVDLGGRQRAVAEQFLDRAQVGPALEQVGGEGVTQPVRVRKQPSERARVQAPAPGGEEQRVFGSAGQLGACLPKVARHPVTGLLAERDVALLAALALNMDALLLEVHVAQIEIHKLTAS